jgi:hypothetical protein
VIYDSQKAVSIVTIRKQLSGNETVAEFAVAKVEVAWKGEKDSQTQQITLYGFVDVLLILFFFFY